MIDKLILAVALSAAVAFGVAGPAYSTEKADKDATVKSDNSKMNKPMHANKEQTADQQGESKADRKMTQEIRKAVIKDKELSSYAHNVKIITKDGAVTLKGPVRSEKEKAKVEAIATKVAGGKVTNEMEVASKDKDKKEMKEHDKKDMKEKK